MTHTNSTLSNIDRIGGAIMDSLDRAALLTIVGLLAWAFTTSLLSFGALSGTERAQEIHPEADTQTMKRLDQTPTHFTPEKAANVIAEMTADDPDWTYTINADPSGKSPWVRVEITDEDGEFVAFV